MDKFQSKFKVISIWDWKDMNYMPTDRKHMDWKHMDYMLETYGIYVNGLHGLYGTCMDHTWMDWNACGLRAHGMERMWYIYYN